VQFLTQKIPKNVFGSNQSWELGSALESANRHSWSADWHVASADWHSFEAQLGNVLIKLKCLHFEFVRIRIHPNLYLIQPSLFFKHQTSINTELKLEIRTLFSDLSLPLR